MRNIDICFAVQHVSINMIKFRYIQAIQIGLLVILIYFHLFISFIFLNIFLLFILSIYYLYFDVL